MFERDRRLAILVSVGYLTVGVIAWARDPTVDAGFDGRTVGDSMTALWAAAIILAILAGVRLDGRSWAWLIPAVVGPIALYPLTSNPGEAPMVLLAVLWPVSALPLGMVVARETPRHGGGILAIVAAVAGMATLLGLSQALIRPVSAWVVPLWLVAVAAIVAIPALGHLALDELRESPWRDLRQGSRDLSASQVTERLTMVVVAAAPALAGTILVTRWEVGVAAVLAATAVGAIAVRIAVRPLAWVASRASAQRDLAVAASDAERSRLAADLHDGPLQDVLLLARRLEMAGDAEGASTARAIGDELRDLSGDLRLPLLDDLGVGPALDWLADRVRRMTALDIEVDCAADGRVPRDVELAAFRIAQEAIANAVRHGSPPIIVRCRTSASALSMSVEDAGHGHRAGTGADRAPDRGHFGLVNMQQRAEQVGAQLEWRQPRGGGTRMDLEWRSAAL